MFWPRISVFSTFMVLLFFRTPAVAEAISLAKDASLLVDARANGTQYAYAASIIYDNGIYHMYTCGAGKNGVHSWDYIRHSSSVDRTNWTPEKIVMVAKNAADISSEWSACDPSVVQFNSGDGDYFYLYYGGGTGRVYVARSKSPNGPFEKFTGAAWSSNPSAVAVAVALPKNLSVMSTVESDQFKTTAFSGAGQPSVVVKGGRLYMWYSDDTTEKIQHKYKTYMQTSSDGIHWSVPVLTNVPESSSISADVKFDPTSGLFILFDIENQISPASKLIVMSSSDGKSWQNYSTVCDSNCLPHYSHNVGVSGDSLGQLMGYDTLITFGSEYVLNNNQNQWGAWNLWGSRVDLRSLPGLSMLLPSTSMGTAKSNSELWPASNAVNTATAGCYGSRIATGNNINNPDHYYFAAWTRDHRNLDVNLIRFSVNPGMAFPLEYDLYLANKTNTAWDHIGLFKNQPDALGKVEIDLPVARLTGGVLIVPTRLGTDAYGNRYLQICKVNLDYRPPVGFRIREAAGSTPAIWPASSVVTNGPYACYSSQASPAANNPLNYFFAAWLPAVQSINAVTFNSRTEPRADGSPGMAFPRSYDIYLTNPENTEWIFAGTYQTQPYDLNGLVSVRLPKSYRTLGVMIVPRILGSDAYGNYYLQICGAQLVRF